MDTAAEDHERDRQALDVVFRTSGELPSGEQRETTRVRDVRETEERISQATGVVGARKVDARPRADDRE
ncbi:hypothetical protein BS329_27870 [Amycolatopsis coloradensis]|uniref:Uncharacterized protein n=1 Tax=Amycolatopsis coloradensis TaxID=76021 RepID=A0A1R0KM25_9PSEU|nr:hypothetical protein [Amycolatopsis coloradensis]OLZ47694.1 hypothetical protein BS329_27870 [Amycolatopsis coloradensis]